MLESLTFIIIFLDNFLQQKGQIYKCQQIMVLRSGIMMSCLGFRTLILLVQFIGCIVLSFYWLEGISKSPTFIKNRDDLSYNKFGILLILVA